MQSKDKEDLKKVTNIFSRSSRDKRLGGGIAMGVHKSLQPNWVCQGEGEVEILTVVGIKVEEMKIRIMNAYGPQEYNYYDRKDRFWKEMGV